MGPRIVCSFDDSKVRQLVLGWIVLLDSMPQAVWGRAMGIYVYMYIYIYIYTYFFQDGLEFRRCEAVPVFFSESMEKLLLLETQQFTIFIYLQYETTKGVILTTAEK